MGAPVDDRHDFLDSRGVFSPDMPAHVKDIVPNRGHRVMVPGGALGDHRWVPFFPLCSHAPVGLRVLLLTEDIRL